MKAFTTKVSMAALVGAVSLLTLGSAVAYGATLPTAVTGAASAITPSTAALAGTINPEGLATLWFFQYALSTSSSYTSQTPSTSAGSGSSALAEKFTVTGLAPATSYNFRIVAVSSAGQVTGAALTFNTSAAPAVITGAASAITVSAATLNGIVNPEGLATTASFQYGTTTSLGNHTAYQHLVAGPNNAVVTAAIKGLAIDTQYFYRMVASSSAGTSLGATYSLTTGRSVSLNVSSSTESYGQFVTLSGSVVSGAAGVHVSVQSERFNSSAFSSIVDVLTGAGGAWSFRTQPTARTTFQVIANGGASSPAIVSVRPVIYLNRLANGRLSTRVVGASSFGSHVLQLQRLSKNNWVTWKSVRLNSSGKATFTTSLPKGKTSIRMAIGPFVSGINQSAPGYLAGYSRSIVYVH